MSDATLHKPPVSSPPHPLTSRGLSPPERRAALQPAEGWLRAAPPGERRPFLKTHPNCRLSSTNTNPVSEKPGKVRRLQSSQKTCAWERETYCRGDGSSNELVEILAVIQDQPFDREEMRESLFARVGAEADPQINVIEWAQTYVMVQWSARPSPGAEPLRGIVLAMASWPTAMKAASGQWGVHIIGYVGTGETLGRDFCDPLYSLFWTPGRRWRAVTGLSELTTRIPLPGLDHASREVARLAD